ncbi:RNA-directed DNA polymerase, eukaryota, reverse transcriptase zinc-binding domain protein [Tanacetum coccineum]
MCTIVGITSEEEDASESCSGIGMPKNELLFMYGASQSTFVKEGEPFDTADSGATTLAIGAITLGAGILTQGEGLSNSSNKGMGKKDCGEELKNCNIVDVEEGECVDSSEDVIDCESKKESVQNEEHKSSYASKAKSMTYDNKLSHIPTSTNEDGSYKMSVQELRNETGVESVIKNGLWMVNGKPMFVQKWDPTVCLDRAKPNKLPLCVKLRNLPLEAWSNKGISALAARLGTPLITDKVTIDICNGGMGRVGFARVLIEVAAGKGLPNNIDIVYKDGKSTVIGKKYVKVQYD